MKVKIYQPAKSAMQSGKKNNKEWRIEAVTEKNEKSLNPLMGWVSGNNTETQLQFKFPNKKEAIAFAKSQNFEYEIFEPKTSSIKKKSYAQNFTN
jgi:hypothetical protein